MEESLELRVRRLESVYPGVTRLETKLDSLDDKLDAIIRIEQTQIEHLTAINRAFAQIEKLDQKASETDRAFQSWTSYENGRRQTWNLIFGTIQILVLAAIGWQFNATQTLRDSVHILEARAQADYRSDYERGTSK